MGLTCTARALHFRAPSRPARAHAAVSRSSAESRAAPAAIEERGAHAAFFAALTFLLRPLRSLALKSSSSLAHVPMTASKGA